MLAKTNECTFKMVYYGYEITPLLVDIHILQAVSVMHDEFTESGQWTMKGLF